MSSTRATCIHWFRKGLRLHDNPSLMACLEPYGDGNELLELRAIFILDPWFVANARVGPNRWRFLQESLDDLDSSLKKLGSRLLVIRGSPEEVFKRVFKEWNVKRLTFEIDTEPYAKVRDETICSLAERNSIEIVRKTSHTLFSPNSIIRTNCGKTPLTYQKFTTLIHQMGPPPKPIDDITDLPPKCRIASSKLLDDDTYNPPTLTELLGKDFESKLEILEDFPFVGGETVALKRMDKYLCEKNAAWVRNFEKPNTSPNSIEPSTTVLSPYLKFGCLSVRTMYWRLQDLLKGSKHSQPPVSLVGQLLWREFFYTCGATVDNFDKMIGNSVCRQIPWKNNNEYLEAWRDAKTGFPFIDAIMTQLRREGWIHHLARHAVACFLTRGDLWVSWEEGMHVFEEYLLDADWSLNAGNWMWLSASAFFHQYYRVYSPIAFGKKTDPRGLYIRKYLPQLAKYPDNYIYEPWTAPISVQKACGCVIGQDYPKPIVDHATASKVNIGRMKAAYAENRADEDDDDTPKKGASKRKGSSEEPTSGSKKSKDGNKNIKDFFKKSNKK